MSDEHPALEAIEEFLVQAERQGTDYVGVKTSMLQGLLIEHRELMSQVAEQRPSKATQVEEVSDICDGLSATNGGAFVERALGAARDGFELARAIFDDDSYRAGYLTGFQRAEIESWRCTRVTLPWKKAAKAYREAAQDWEHIAVLQKRNGENMRDPNASAAPGFPYNHLGVLGFEKLTAHTPRLHEVTHKASDTGQIVAKEQQPAPLWQRTSEAQSRHPFTRGQVVEIRTGKRAGQRHPVLDVYHAYEENERPGVSIRDEDTELFYGLDEVSSLVCGCPETYPQLVAGQVSHGPGCALRPGEANPVVTDTCVECAKLRRFGAAREAHLKMVVAALAKKQETIEMLESKLCSEAAQTEPQKAFVYSVNGPSEVHVQCTPPRSAEAPPRRHHFVDGGRGHCIYCGLDQKLNVNGNVPCRERDQHAEGTDRVPREVGAQGGRQGSGSDSHPDDGGDSASAGGGPCPVGDAREPHAEGVGALEAGAAGLRREAVAAGPNACVTDDHTARARRWLDGPHHPLGWTTKTQEALAALFAEAVARWKQIADDNDRSYCIMRDALERERKVPYFRRTGASADSSCKADDDRARNWTQSHVETSVFVSEVTYASLAAQFADVRRETVESVLGRLATLRGHGPRVNDKHKRSIDQAMGEIRGWASQFTRKDSGGT